MISKFSLLKWVVPEKINTSPTEEISAVWGGREETFVSHNSKCIWATWTGGGGGVNR